MYEDKTLYLTAMNGAYVLHWKKSSGVVNYVFYELLVNACVLRFTEREIRISGRHTADSCSECFRLCACSAVSFYFDGDSTSELKHFGASCSQLLTHSFYFFFAINVSRSTCNVSKEQELSF